MTGHDTGSHAAFAPICIVINFFFLGVQLLEALKWLAGGAARVYDVLIGVALPR